MGFTWTRHPRAMAAALVADYETLVRVSVAAVMTRRAPEIENWMKDNAPWEDRTGNARQTLYTQVEMTLTEVLVWMAHGMDYGIYLETSQAGLWGILADTVDHWAPILMADVRELLR